MMEGLQPSEADLAVAELWSEYGMSYLEIAEELGISYPSVCQHLSRYRQRTMLSEAV